MIAVSGGAIVCRMGARVRRGEELPVTRKLGEIGMPILRTIHGTGLLEGGSFAWIDRRTAVIGIGTRANEEGARQVEEVLRIQGVELLRVQLPGYRQHIDGVFVMLDVDLASTRLAEFLTGGVDLIQDLPVENVKQVRENKELQVVQGKGVRQIFFPLNTRADTPLKDKRVRQAINFAIDREAIVRDVLQGFGEPRPGPFGVRQIGYNAEAAKAAAYNPEKAKALLKEAGYASGVDLTWNVCRGCFLKDAEIIETIANELKAVGIRVKLNLLEVNQLLANQNTGNFQVGMIRWSRQYDSDTVLAGIQAQSTTQKWGGNEELDKLIVRARQTLDRGAREKLYQEIYKVMVDDAGYVFVHAQDSVFGKRAATDWAFWAFAGNASLTLLYK